MKTRYAAAAAVLIGGLAIGSYLHFRPHIHQASLAELQQVSPPELVQSKPSDLVAEDRYERLVKIAQTLPKATLILATFKTRKERPAPNTDVVLSEVRRILLEGPLRRPLKRAENYDKELAPFSRVLSAICADADSALATGDSRRCADDLVLAFEFSTAAREARGSHLGFVVMTALDSLATTEILRCVRSGRLAAKDLARVLNGIPSGTASDAVLADDWSIDFQMDVLPVLSDVVAVRKEIAEASSQYYDPKTDVAGSYDAKETARTIGAIYRIGQRNAFDDWKHQNPQAIDIAESARSKIPLGSRRPEGGKTNLILYDLEMNVADNSLGNELIASGIGLIPIRRTSVLIATRHELLRCVVAAKIYESNHHGALPPDLATLVTDHELASPPVDWFACQPPHYDRQRKFVCSLGPGGRDDIREFAHDGWTREQDFGYFIDEPTKK